MTETLFTPRDGGYMPSPHTRSPWSLQLLHGGPVAALLAHHVEQLIPDNSLRVARVTTDLFRPVPFAPLTVDTEILRKGRRIMVVRASIISEGVEVSRAQALMLRASDVDASSGDLLPAPIPFPEDAPGAPLDNRAGEPTYPKCVRWRWTAERGGSAPATAWIHVPLVLLPGVPLSPVVRSAAISDFASPLSNMHLAGGAPFINADIALYLFRPPIGDWLCLATTGRGSREGIALGEAFLHDRHGPAGRCLTMALAQPFPPPEIQGG